MWRTLNTSKAVSCAEIRQCVTGGIINVCHPSRVISFSNFNEYFLGNFYPINIFLYNKNKVHSDGLTDTSAKQNSPLLIIGVDSSRKKLQSEAQASDFVHRINIKHFWDTLIL